MSKYTTKYISTILCMQVCVYAYVCVCTNGCHFVWILLLAIYIIQLNTIDPVCTTIYSSLLYLTFDEKKMLEIFHFTSVCIHKVDQVIQVSTEASSLWCNRQTSFCDIIWSESHQNPESNVIRDDMLTQLACDAQHDISELTTLQLQTHRDKQR